jgi:low temperature requirement protein LtrA
MTEELTTTRSRFWPWRRPMPMRDHTVEHRASTPLELLFDLCFVVAVALLGYEFHHAVVDGHALDGAVRYAALFLPVWWAWMLFTWFAAAFDNDDVPYRLLTLVQMVGVLGVAASVPVAFDGDYRAFTISYTVIRVAQVAQWLRGAREHPAERTFALRYAIGIAGCQVIWLALLLVDDPWRYAGYALLMALELAVPRWAVSAVTRPAFHLHHVTERYGLFTLIVIGESILAAVTAVRNGLEHGATTSLLAIGVASLIAAFSVWWLYFDFVDGQALLGASSVAFRWGYGHYLVFAAIGAMGAGAMVAVDIDEEHLDFGIAPRLAIAVPAACYVVAVAWIRSFTEPTAPVVTAARLGSAVLVVGLGVLAGAGGATATVVAVAGVLMAQAVAETVWAGVRARRS